MNPGDLVEIVACRKLAKTKASVYAPQKVTVAEAYQAFLAVLKIGDDGKKSRITKSGGNL